MFTAWVGGFVAITVISLLSLLGVVLIPLMGHVFFKFLLCFLVALAVGTLSGDAFLHLIPHVSQRGVVLCTNSDLLSALVPKCKFWVDSVLLDQRVILYAFSDCRLREATTITTTKSMRNTRRTWMVYGKA